MKNIKFRAWNKDLNTNGGMVWNVAVLNGKYFDPYGMGTQDYPLMQYTGLKDKNGAKIYEGDIVEGFTDSLAVVKYLRGGFIFELHYSWVYFQDLGGEVEVIGNIYENPKLLKEEI